jgi:ABC-type multidrug transport system fused ATPase/permease subunit
MKIKMNTLNDNAVERSSTLFLKLVLLVLSMGFIALLGFVLYQITQSDFLGEYRSILIGVIISIIPLLYIFYQAFLLLINIDHNLSLTESSVNSLRIIKICSFLISLLYLIGSPFIFNVAERDDAPGVVLINLILILGPFTVGVFTYILQKLLINAIGYKSESELTI